MNKIFKVIWNNAKHCYVVASELAKSYTNGCGSRSIRRVAAALCVATAIYATTGSALAVNTGGQLDIYDNYIGDTPYHVTIDSDVSGNVYGHKENSEYVEEASVTMTGGTVGGEVRGGFSNSGSAASNSVTISGGTVNRGVYGGWSYSGNAASNSVNISGGTELQSLL